MCGIFGCLKINNIKSDIPCFIKECKEKLSLLEIKAIVSNKFYEEYMPSEPKAAPTLPAPSIVTLMLPVDGYCGTPLLSILIASGRIR